MLLVIDIGNTEIVIGIYDNDTLKGHWRLSSSHPKTIDECWGLLNIWLHNDGFLKKDIQGIIISSVVPYFQYVFRDMARKKFNIEPVIISYKLDIGIKILYDSPEMVGADRICNAVGGYFLYGSPLIIVDFGTATTFDVVSEKGEYIGGVIALGLKGASQQLHHLAAKLPRVELEFPDSVVGTNTEHSMQSGIMWGAVSLIDGIVKKILEEKKWEEAKLIATGGMASEIVKRSEILQQTSPFLTLEGMKIIYKRIVNSSL
ncbi:MAG: type III pantothenate kinase [bacterium]